jgi:glycosyltransferase involved in cell wall biosynthesis
VLLSKVLGVPAAQIFALSNAAFLEPAVAQNAALKSTLRLGFLSNITAEKGIFDFFDLAERLQKSGLAVECMIAGPVGEGVKDVFFRRMAELPNVSHVGPVYGEAKEAFYRSLDVLAFPTRYANEAEPVTILEAFRAGVPVIANHRGCIATMIDESSGLGVAQAGQFVDEAATLLTHWLAEPMELDRYRAGARARFAKLQVEHSQRLDWMISRIVSGLPLGDEQ